ncbi:MAG: nucleotidyltransferase domain-containing protein [Thermofilum sp.]
MRLEDCLREISERLEPSVEEKTRLEREATRVTEALWRALELAGRRTQVSSIELQGSFARDTWLPGDVDIDIFLLFEKGVGLETLQETTRIVSRLAAEALGASLQVR